MKQRNSCRVVINPIFGNATIQKMLDSRGSQLERRRKMEELVTQIEKDFDDLDSLVIYNKTDCQGNNNIQSTTVVSVTTTKKIRRSSIRTKLSKGEDIVQSLQKQLATLNISQRTVVESRLVSKWEKLMKSGEVSKNVLSVYNGNGNGNL